MPQAFGGGRGGPPRRGDRREHLIERAILAIEQQIVLAVEIVIEVGGRQVGGVGNVAHARLGEAAIAKQPGGGAQNRVPLAIAAAGPWAWRRRQVNGCSIFEPRFIMRRASHSWQAWCVAPGSS